MSKKREKRRKWKKCFLHLQTLIKNNVEIFLAPDMSDVQGWLIARKSFFPIHVSQEEKQYTMSIQELLYNYLILCSVSHIAHQFI